MGGLYIIARGTNSSKYNGMVTDLTLPTHISSDNVKGIKPECIVGAYSPPDANKKTYGLDMGILWESNAFKPFYWALSGTCTTGNQGNIGSGLSGVKGGDKIQLKIYLNGSKITLEVIKSGTKLQQLDAPLSDAAKSAVSGGVYFNRELVVAADPTPPPNVNPCNIYITNPKFSNGTLTILSSGLKENLNSTTSKITKNKQIDTNKPNITLSTLKVLTSSYGDDAGFGWESGSADLNQK